jgi:threonine dehydratase
MNQGVKKTLLARVYEVASITPLQAAPKLSKQLKCRVLLKREDLQPINSFKLRGAYNKIAQLTASQKARGVITASAGNHAQGVALSAQKLGISALIVMPRTTPAIKVEAVKDLEAEVRLSGDSYSEAYRYSRQLVKKTGRVFIHPFDDPLVIAGQGTIGREILDQNKTVTHIFVPVGGGGLLAGVAEYVKTLRPDVQVIGVEPADSAAMYHSLNEGKRITLPHVGIFADGVAVKQVGRHTFALAKQYVDRIITVDNDQICAAIKSIFEDTRSIVEPAGALAVAGAQTLALEDRLPRDATLAAICSGANTTFERLQFVAERTLLGSGQEVLFAVRLDERSGTLREFCEKVVKDVAISEFNYRLGTRNGAHIFVGVKISSDADKHKFVQNLRQHGYRYENLTHDDLAKEHIRHMIGGSSMAAKSERLYVIEFPERPRALNDFLQKIGKRWNISLFHYRGQGGDLGSVLIGFEAQDGKILEQNLQQTGYEFQYVKSVAAELFIK